MTRLIVAGLILLATVGASPPPSLPVPPIPPANPPVDHSAPMPDRDLEGPSAAAGGVRVGLQDFRVQRFYPGLGFTPGSHFETSEEKRPIQTPGVSVQVPLQ